MYQHCNEHPQVEEAGIEVNPCVAIMVNETEEGMKAE
jgi:hypothetical protein